MQKSARANWYLLLVTIIWGLTFPIIKDAVAHLDAFLFVAIRFALAALLLLPWVWPVLKTSRKNIIQAGLILGTLNSLSYGLQTLSLTDISPARCAFITGFSVILVPIISPLLGLPKPKIIDFLSAIVCLFGLYILTGASFHSLHLGDAWVFLSAVLFSVVIVYLQIISQRLKNDLLLTFYLILFTAPFSLLIFMTQRSQTEQIGWVAVSALIFCALFATVITFFLQTKYQKETTANQAALIFALEPVFASLFSYLIHDDKFDLTTVLGAMLILVGLILPIVYTRYIM